MPKESATIGKINTLMMIDEFPIFLFILSLRQMRSVLWFVLFLFSLLFRFVSSTHLVVFVWCVCDVWGAWLFPAKYEGNLQDFLNIASKFLNVIRLLLPEILSAVDLILNTICTHHIRRAGTFLLFHQTNHCSALTDQDYQSYQSNSSHHGANKNDNDRNIPSNISLRKNSHPGIPSTHTRIQMRSRHL